MSPGRAGAGLVPQRRSTHCGEPSGDDRCTSIERRPPGGSAMRRRTAFFLATVPFLLLLGWAAAGTVLAGGGCHGEDEVTATEGSSSVVRRQGCTFGPAITRVAV